MHENTKMSFFNIGEMKVNDCVPTAATNALKRNTFHEIPQTKRPPERTISQSQVKRQAQIIIYNSKCTKCMINLYKNSVHY